LIVIIVYETKSKNILILLKLTIVVTFFRINFFVLANPVTTNLSTSFAGSSIVLCSPGDTVLSASYSWQQTMPRRRSITNPLKLKARLEQIIISKDKLKEL
jgi:hypothetical protein